MPPPRGSRRVFGQAMGKGQPKRSSYQRQFGGGSNGNKSTIANNSNANNKMDDSALLAAKRRIRQQKAEQIDEKFGYETFAFENTNGAESRQARERRGWLFNMLPTTVCFSFCLLYFGVVIQWLKVVPAFLVFFDNFQRMNIVNIQYLFHTENSRGRKCSQWIGWKSRTCRSRLVLLDTDRSSVQIYRPLSPLLLRLAQLWWWWRFSGRTPFVFEFFVGYRGGIGCD